MPDTTFGNGGWTPERLDSLSGKTFVITGANSGTGFEASRILLSKGAKVVMLNRSMEKSKIAMEKLKADLGEDVDVSLIRMDLSELESVRNAANDVLKSVPSIDALICNAAIAQVPKQRMTKDGFESMIATNHYGHFLLCGMLFDRINESNGRIVVVASLGYKMGMKTIKFDDMNWDNDYHQNNTYCHSKLAQMMFAYELQDRIKNKNKQVKVYVCHPGASRTSLVDTSGNWITKFFANLFAWLPVVQSAEKGAYPEIMCATEDQLEERAFYGPTGMFETSGPVGKGTLESYAVEKEVLVKLWDVTERNIDFTWSL